MIHVDHASRCDGSFTAVHALDIASFDVPAAPADWVDRTVVQVAQAAIASIEVDGLTLVRDPSANPPSWRASAGLAGGERLDAAAVERLAAVLATLTIAAPLGQASRPDFALDQPALVLAVVRGDGTRIDDRLGGKRAAGDRALKVSLRPEYFTVAGYEADRLLHAAACTELVPPAAPSGPGAAAHPAPEPARP